MRKLLILACAVAVLAGCKSVPFFSSSDLEAHPSGMWDNGDGSAIVEFKFIMDPFDARKAMQRIDEYLTKYSGEKGYAGYDVLSVNEKPIPAGDNASPSWMAPASENFFMSPADIMTTGSRSQFGRIRVQVRFGS